MNRRDWGDGIPNYTKSDLMTEEELIAFALEVVAEYELTEDGYELLDCTSSPNVFPNIVLKKNGKLIFITVKVAIAPDRAMLSNFWKNIYGKKAKEYGARCYFAPVGFGSRDADRFNASLALRGDSYLINYVGMEELTGDIPLTKKEIKQGKKEMKRLKRS